MPSLLTVLSESFQDLPEIIISSIVKLSGLLSGDCETYIGRIATTGLKSSEDILPTETDEFWTILFIAILFPVTHLTFRLFKNLISSSDTPVYFRETSLQLYRLSISSEMAAPTALEKDSVEMMIESIIIRIIKKSKMIFSDFLNSSHAIDKQSNNFI